MADKEVIVTQGGTGTPKGGQVVLIFVVLMTGYLYVTGKLQAVLAAIKGGSTTAASSGPTLNLPSLATPPSGGSTTPFYDSSIYPYHFNLRLDPRYGIPPIPIAADSQTICQQLVYNEVLKVTGSITEAMTYARASCP